MYIKREEERIFEYLNAPVEYVEPKWLVKELEERMEELGQGVITIFMERGTGKSAFANQMNGLYHSNTLIQAAFSRSYHIQNAVLRGISDFVNAINFGYRHSCNSDDDLYGSEEELPVISLHDENLQQSLASLEYSYYLEALKDTIALLEDYTIPIKDDMGNVDEDNDGPIYTIFNKIGRGYKMAELLGEENIHRLYVAFINRLNYERERGNFEDFICELYHFNDHLLGKNYGEDWPEKAAVIIPDLISIEGGMYNFATNVLVDLMTKLADWLEKKNRFSEEIDILGKLMDGIDGRHFLIGHTDLVNYDKLMDSSGWGIAERWYPTDNALYLLKLLNRLGLCENVKIWMDAMERSCSFVDEVIYKDERLTIAHELQKYRFLQVRKLLDYYSAFDDQVEELVSNHRVYILSELENISDNSAFGQIHYETELLLDHAWQMKQWDLGIEECDRILDSILKIEERKNSDMVIQSVGVLKDKIKRCKALFLFMFGIGDNSETEVSKTELISSYDDPNYILGWCLWIFEDEDATASEKMDKILEKIEIKLGD